MAAAVSKTAPQIPINNTVQVSVPPGDQTGLYYILISNSRQLPWQTSWQQVKDHVRTVCAVERVEIFNESTSGWVSVRGRESFDLALQFLSTELFNGRPTFADGRNAEQSIPIKKLVDTSLPDSTSRSPQTPRYTPPPPVSYSISSPPLSKHSTAEYGHWNAAPTYSTNASSAIDYVPYSTSMSTASLSTVSATASPWYSSSNTMQTSAYMQSSGSMQSNPSMSPYYENASYQTPASYYGSTDYRNARVPSHVPSSVHEAQQTNTVAVEWRKIVIKGLPSWAQYEHVRSLLMDRASLQADRAGFVNISLSSRSDGSSGRRHATVTFSDEKTASGIITELNGVEIGGMRLTVEMAKEGVSKGEEHRPRGEKRHAKKPASSGHHHSNHSSRPHREERDRKESSARSSKEKDSSRSSSSLFYEKRDSTRPSREKESSRHSSSLAYEKKGSTGSSTTLSYEKKDKSQTKRGVVIADGSSRRSSESSKKTK
ncbi:uncharacterized protein PG986_008099 [Apiospora aurea]|uniref:RRM domain-containing protein n=1 Tax=Apiospora aurea TaxID=335848 RepID=A0ABR1QEG5_9PEZI